MDFKHLTLVSSLFVGLCAGANATVTITDFGSTDIGGPAYTIVDGNFTTSQTADSMTIAGGDIGTFVVGTFAPTDISMELGILITGVVTQNPGSAFFVEVFDSNSGESVFEGGSWNDLNNTGETFFTYASGDAVLTDIIALQISTAGSGDALNATLTGATAIPEPGTALLGLLGLATLLRRRR